MKKTTAWAYGLCICSFLGAALFSVAFAQAMDVPSRITIVDVSKQAYTHEQLLHDARRLAKDHPELIQLRTIGTSHLGREIPAVLLGSATSDQRILVQGGIHGREYMTAQLMMKQIEFYARNKSALYQGKKIADILETCAVWFVPMVNPDGAMLSMKGLESVKDEKTRAFLKGINGGSTNFARWKANARGVDLNQNFPSKWELSGKPGPLNYSGAAALSEKESAALAAFTLEVDPTLALSYHACGSCLYWYYGQTGEALARNLRLATQISKLTGYRFVPNAQSLGGQGYRDWFIEKTKKPGITIEIGPQSPPTPQPISYFENIFARNVYVPVHAAFWAINEGE